MSKNTGSGIRRVATPKDIEKPKLTVSGVTFDASQVKSATVLIDGREVYIGEKSDSKKIGFKPE